MSFLLKLRKYHEGGVGKKWKEDCETLFVDGHDIAAKITKNTTAVVVCSGHVGIEPVNCQLWIGVHGALSH